MKKSKFKYNGRPVFYDERDQMFVEAGKSRIYLNGETVKKLEKPKRKKREKPVVAPKEKKGILKRRSTATKK